MGESSLSLRTIGNGKRTMDDPLFASGDALCRLYTREGIIDIDDEELCHQVLQSFPCEVPGCQKKYSSLLEFEAHYMTCHRHICSQCRKPLPSAFFLDLHLSEKHDSFFAAQAQRKPMYRCFVEDCPVLFQDGTLRRSHCIEVHSFPHDFRYDQSLRKKTKKSCPKKKNNVESMVVEEDEVTKPPVHVKQFYFGNSKRGKSFSSCKPWHAQGKQPKDSQQVKMSTLSTTELMDTLPHL